jgi:hypothetical protein
VGHDARNDPVKLTGSFPLFILIVLLAVAAGLAWNWESKHGRIRVGQRH